MDKKDESVKILPQKKVKISKKNYRGTVVTTTGYELDTWPCSYCVEFKSPKDFFVNFDHSYEKVGISRYCKSCMFEIYDNMLLSEKDQNKAMLRFCRLVNWMYREESINSANKANDKRQNLHFISRYHIALNQYLNLSATNGGNSVGRTFGGFIEPTSFNLSNQAQVDVIGQDVIDFWGEGYSEDDYRWLSNEYAFFKEGHKADLPSEITLLKEVCFKNFEIKKLRVEGKPVNDSVKQLQELFKSLAISPQYQNMANSGKALDTFGNWIADIEKESPAQWLKHEKTDLFRDIDDPEKYFLKYFVSPLKTFILQSKTWTLEHDDLVDGSDDIDSDDGEILTEEEK